MAKYFVAPSAEVPVGTRKVFKVGGRPVAVFNLNGEFFAILNKCPHQGAELCKGVLVGSVSASQPGEYSYDSTREIIRCPWHGWEFDIRTGDSWFDPQHTRVRSYPASVASGATYVKGPYKAEVFPVATEEDYLVIEV